MIIERSGKYCYQIITTLDGVRKKIRSSGYDNRQEAQEAYDRHVLELNGGEYKPTEE